MFQTDQQDVAEYAGEATNPDGTPYSYYVLIDGVTTRGFEIEAAGAINERWNASFGPIVLIASSYRALNAARPGSRLRLPRSKATWRL